MRFAEIRRLLLNEWMATTTDNSEGARIHALFEAINKSLIILAEQEAIRESVPVRQWQHGDTGRMTEMAESPGPRWHEVPVREPGPTLRNIRDDLLRIVAQLDCMQRGEK